ncbi:uncharacterized protein FPOAC1_012934 [Fusarium poae]|uniref:uncharacterized protein n=1 Tax=Fusarium poae TaxID=36050 RepID=UPI001D056076|nr:uncharacterized protein FPOAC1_012934 [Fusarium poae]KAG8664957.1 hypothetical protein FPOAC1_012934 [Fusarium poae]
MSLNGQSPVFGPDMQMDSADEDGRSWHMLSTPPRSHESYPDGMINRANDDRRENSVTRSEHPLSETHDEERSDPIAAEVPTRQEIYNWVEEEELDEGEKLARRIVYILTAGLVSCPADQHKNQDASHLATCRRHLHLRETWAGSSARRKLAPAVHDIDSFLHITKDPRSLRRPLNIYITAQPSLLLSKSIHVRVPIRVGEKIKQVPIYQIPHTVLAHQRPRTVYMFFPRLYDEKRRKKGPVPLREEQNRLFFDGFIRPSIEKIGPHFMHHLPESYDSVRAASHIARESSGSAAVRGAAFEVPYSEENLPRLWSVMQEALDRAERDMAADGLRPGDGGGVRETEDASSQEDEEGEGENYDLDEGDWQAPNRRGSEEEQAAGDGWKPPRTPRAATTEYPVHMLRDSISTTSEPRRTSPIFRRGVSYVQSYTVEEGNFNVAAIWAFLHPNIFNLAHSEEAWAAVARTGNIKASRQDTERALSQSIQRMASNLEDPSRGYGWRVELRITTALAAQLRPAEIQYKHIPAFLCNRNHISALSQIGQCPRELPGPPSDYQALLGI